MSTTNEFGYLSANKELMPNALERTMREAKLANFRHYVIYDFRGKAPRSLYRLRERLESRGLAEWVQYSVVGTETLDIALQIAYFCRERGAKVELITGVRYPVG